MNLRKRNIDIIKKCSKNLTFWSAVSGFLGALLTFKFGLPAEIHADGHINLVLEQIDQNQVYTAEIYDLFGRIGLFLIAVSFFLQLLDIIKNLKKEPARDASL